MSFHFVLWALAGLGWTVSGSTAATPLCTEDAVAYSQADYLAWVNPLRCDQDGNVLLLLVPHLPPGAETARLPGPSVVLGISAGGRETTLYHPADISAFADANRISTMSLTVASDGTPFLLVWVLEGSAGSQYIVSFDEKGRDRSRVELDGREIMATRIEVFGSGDLLLLGSRTQWRGERIAVMPEGGEHCGTWSACLSTRGKTRTRL